MRNTIRLENVSKIISGNKIFDKLNFEFSGKVYHLTGENGAGKTTLLKLIVGLESLTHGKIFLNDEFISSKIISNIHYAPDDLQIYDFLTGIEFLNWIAKMRLQNNNKLEGLIQGFNLNDEVNKSFAEMSLGTKKKFVLASVLIGKPKFILFDEPFNGLDLDSQEYLKQKIIESSTQSGIIFTHHSSQPLILSCDIHKIKISDHKLNVEQKSQGAFN